MTALVDTLALGVVATGAVVGVLGVATTGRWRPTLAFTLDLWLAAGLLRLAGDPEPARVAAAAAITFVRRLVGAALRHPAAG